MTRRISSQLRRFLLPFRSISFKYIVLALVVTFCHNLWIQDTNAATRSAVRGIVTDGETGSPIESAVVQLELTPNRMVVDETTTDKDGRFAFVDVATGEYQIRSEKSGYLDVLFGKETSKEVSVSGMGFEPIRLSLVRSCVITGRVFDVAGQPARGAKVVALNRRAVRGAIRLQPEGDGVLLDDRGEFRLYDLIPGFYTLAVVPAGEPNTAGFAPLYFPRVTEAGRADFIEMHPGETRSDIEMSLPAGRTQEIKGTVTGISSDWGEHAVAVSLLPVDGISLVIQSVMADKNGNFRFPAIPPGSYRVIAYGPVIARGSGGPMAGENSRHGAVNIEIIGGDLGDVTIALSKGVAVEVSVLMEPTSNEKSVCYAHAEADLQSVDTVPTLDESFRARLAKDSALMHEIPIGRYTAKLGGLGMPCFVQDVTFGEQRGPVINLNKSGKLVFILSTRSGSITGTVVGDDGSVKPRAQVILVPPEEAPEMLTSQIRTTKSDERGSFRLDQIPPGHYRILAILNPTSNKYLDPLFWSQNGILEIVVKPDVTINSELRITR
jgi:protocatechuate 3,4-dioxygenase beta subunit